MKLHYKLELKDYKAALRLHATSTLGKRINYYFWYLVIPVLAVLGLTLFIFGGLSETLGIASPYRWVEGALVWLSIFLPLMRFINTRRCFKVLLPRSFRDKDVSLDVNDECIISEIPGVSAGKYYWNENMAVVCDKKVVLMYVAKKRFIPIPATSVSESQLREIRELIEKNTGKK